MNNDNAKILKDLTTIRETIQRTHELQRQEQVNNEYIFTKLKLTEEEFYSLAFMGPPPAWKKYLEEDKVPLNLCFKRLIDVVEILRKETKGDKDDPYSVFKGLEHVKTPRNNGSFNKESWFRSHVLLSKRFHKKLMPPLWIRNVTRNGNETENGAGPFYVQDGNHRALVYAMRLACSCKGYEPVSALHATSWDFAQGILGFEIQEASELDQEGRFYPDNRDYITGFGADIKIYERLE